MLILSFKINVEMKKLFPLLFAVLVISACDINTDGTELTATSTINEAIAVSIPQTNGTAASFNQTANQNLNDIFTNFVDVQDVNINSLNYEYQNVTGNADAVIESATIVINGVTIANLTNVNIAQEASNGTVFQITDTSILDQIEALFLSNTVATIEFSGTAISNGGTVNFEIALDISLTVTL